MDLGQTGSLALVLIWNPANSSLEVSALLTFNRL